MERKSFGFGPLGDPRKCRGIQIAYCETNTAAAPPSSLDAPGAAASLPPATATPNDQGENNPADGGNEGLAALAPVARFLDGHFALLTSSPFSGMGAP